MNTNNEEQLNQKIAAQAAYISQLEQANTFNTKGLTLLTHELKGFLGNVRWIARAAAEETLSPETIMQELLPELGSIAQQNIRLLQEVNDWIKAKQNHIEVAVQTIYCKEWLESISTHFSNTLALKNIRITYSGKENLSFDADKTLLPLMVRKIIDNAIKYSHPNSEVTVHFALCTNNELQITIQDKGVGMDTETCALLFTLEHPSFLGTQKEKGAGLGLIIAKDLMEMIKGDIIITSKKDEYTEVILKIPYITYPNNN